MKSITIHKMDDETQRRLEARAQQEGISLNKLIKRLLRGSLGLDKPKIDHRADFQEFLGTWTEADVHEFETSIQSLDQIDESLWE